MKKSFSFKTYLQRYFLLYLISIVGISLFSIWIIDLKNKPKREETFGVFFSSLQFDVKKSTSFIKGLSLESIKEVKSYKYRYENMNFWDYFSANGLSYSDVFFLNKDAVDKMVETNYCLSILDVYDNGTLEIYKDISFKVYDYATKNGPLKEFISGEINEDYYACINKNSPHIGLQNKGQTNNISLYLEGLLNEKD